MFDAALVARAQVLVSAAAARGVRIATAESCTGGLVAALLTEVAGASAVVDRGFVTYSNAAKTELLGVDAALVARVGAVSAEVARAMAAGALSRSPADLSVAVTGIAGPGGGSVEKPVGLVHFAGATRGGLIHEEHRFGAIGRGPVRIAAVAVALSLLERLLREPAHRFDG